MDQARLVLDYIDVISWPLVVMAALTLLVLIFRAEIATLIRNIKSASLPLGIAVQVAEQQSVQTEEGPAVAAAFSDIITQKEEEIVEQKLQTTGLTEELARYRLGYFFERTYRIIYGTQIRLLQYLFFKGEVKIEELSHYGEEHVVLARAVAPAYTYPLPLYLGFLESSELMMLQGGKYSITDLGRSFLQWMAAESVNPAKLG